MKKKWLTLGLNAVEIQAIDKLVALNGGGTLSYIYDLHFAHYDSQVAPSGRLPTRFSKEETEYFLRTCADNNIATTLLLNCGDYNFEDIKRILDSFYLPLGVRAVVVADLELVKKIKETFPDLTIQGSCLSYIDTIEGVLKEAACGVQLHNPATWTIRNMGFIKEVKRHGLKQKHIMAEGCARKCKLESWHRRETSNGTPHSLSETCRISIPDIYTFLMGAWITIRQLKRMENDIDVIKLPRNTFDDITFLSKFIERYDSDEPYNILEYVSTPLLDIKYTNTIMSDIFDDAFFDNTVSDTVDRAFLDEYVAKIGEVPFFMNKGA